MIDIEKICSMQRQLDEYERFHSELYFMLVEHNPKRQYVRFDDDEVPWAETLIKEIRKLIEECSLKEK